MSPGAPADEGPDPLSRAWGVTGAGVAWDRKMEGLMTGGCKLLEAHAGVRAPAPQVPYYPLDHLRTSGRGVDTRLTVHVTSAAQSPLGARRRVGGHFPPCSRLRKGDAWTCPRTHSWRLAGAEGDAQIGPSSVAALLPGQEATQLHLPAYLSPTGRKNKN